MRNSDIAISIKVCGLDLMHEAAGVDEWLKHLPRGVQERANFETFQADRVKLGYVLAHYIESTICITLDDCFQ